MSLSSCSVPGSRPTFELSADELELGLGKQQPPHPSHACPLGSAHLFSLGPLCSPGAVT